MLSLQDGNPSFDCGRAEQLFLSEVPAVAATILCFAALEKITKRRRGDQKRNRDKVRITSHGRERDKENETHCEVSPVYANKFRRWPYNTV
jgi:Ni/Co efflux regulator RcnB